MMTIEVSNMNLVFLMAITYRLAAIMEQMEKLCICRYRYMLAEY